MSLPAAARLKALEEELQEVHVKGKEQNVFVGGYGGGHLQADSFEEVQRHEEKRRRLAQEVKEARQEAKAERQQLKSQAGNISDAGSWTAKVLQGDGRFDRSVDSSASNLGQATYGLKSAAEFKETRERLEEQRETAAADEAEAARKREQEEHARRKARQKRQRKEQASKLSFEDEDEAEAHK